MVDGWTSASSVAGVSGALFGAGALVYAVRADRRGKKSDEAAQRSEQLAVEAVTVARESNGLAVDARELAEEANSVSRARSERETERHDVVWEIERVHPGKYWVVNAGQDEAHRVSVAFHVDDEKVLGEAELVEPGDGLSFDMPGAVQTLRGEIHDHRSRLRGCSEFHIAPLINPAIDYGFHVVGARVTWSTALGSPRRQDIHEPMSTLQDWD